MAGLNRIFLIGNLTRDPELQYTGSGAAVARFGLAVNSVYSSSSGERKEEVCFIDIIVWNKLAEACAERLTKGRQVFVDGRLQYRSWEAEDGGKRNKHEVTAQSVLFLGGKTEESGTALVPPSSVARRNENGREDADSADEDGGDIPF